MGCSLKGTVMIQKLKNSYFTLGWAGAFILATSQAMAMDQAQDTKTGAVSASGAAAASAAAPQVLDAVAPAAASAAAASGEAQGADSGAAAAIAVDSSAAAQQQAKNLAALQAISQQINQWFKLGDKLDQWAWKHPKGRFPMAEGQYINQKDRITAFQRHKVDAWIRAASANGATINNSTVEELTRQFNEFEAWLDE